jgi:DNA-binding transcriptional ArsR family regulator
MREFMSITKALADEQRVRMLLALRRRELCVCQIVSLAGLATSTVSKHMSILKQARLVESRKEGRWIYYRLPSEDLPPMVQQAMDWTFECLANDPRIERDQQRLDEICAVDPQQLCSSRNGHQDCRRKTRTGRKASRS